MMMPPIWIDSAVPPGFLQLARGQSVGDWCVNDAGSANTPAGEIDFGSGITDQNLWFQLYPIKARTTHR
jgi:hypothetical protein